MSLQSQFNKRTYDWVTISLFLGLVIIGWLMLYAAVFEKGVDPKIFSIQSTVGSQTIWIIISIIVFWLISNLDWKLWNTFAYPLYGISIALLIGVLIFGVEIKGARSWFRFGSISFQPSEFAKLTTALALAAYLSYYKSDLRKRRSQLITIGIIGLPMVLILLQPDAGSAFIFLAFSILLYREGLSPVFYYIGFSLITAFILTIIYGPLVVISVFMVVVAAVFVSQLYKKLNGIITILGFIIVNILLWKLTGENGNSRIFSSLSMDHLRIGLVSLNTIALLAGAYYLWTKRQRQLVTILLSGMVVITLVSFGSNYFFKNVLKPHQQDRINVWLKPSECDPRGSLYNIIQSKTAIGSGGFAGKGYLNGTMAELNHVPEQTTDFIFSIVGEEQGFIGVASIIILFGLLIYRIILIGERARNLFIRRYAYGLAGILFLHYFINIGMTMGICPVIGIPLPFLSKGGTALLFFSIMIGILVKMDHSRLKN